MPLIKWHCQWKESWMSFWAEAARSGAVLVASQLLGKWVKLEFTTWMPALSTDHKFFLMLKRWKGISWKSLFFLFLCANECMVAFPADDCKCSSTEVFAVCFDSYRAVMHFHSMLKQSATPFTWHKFGHQCINISAVIIQQRPDLHHFTIMSAKVFAFKAPEETEAKIAVW